MRARFTLFMLCIVAIVGLAPTGGMTQSTPTPSADDLQATIEALETQVAGSEPTATKAPTPRPAPTKTPAPTASGTIEEFLAEDRSRGCDRVAHGLTDGADLESPAAESLYLACAQSGMGYAAACFSSTDSVGYIGLPSGQMYVVCYVFVQNGNADFGFVSPIDFGFIDGNDRRYEMDFMSYAMLDQSEALPTTSLSKGQSTQGAVIFQVPMGVELPGYVEIGGSSSLLYEPAVIIIESLPRT